MTTGCPSRFFLPRKKSAMKPPAQDIAARLLVWQALSDFYLDTVLSPEVTQGNARILADFALLPERVGPHSGG